MHCAHLQLFTISCSFCSLNLREANLRKVRSDALSPKPQSPHEWVETLWLLYHVSH